MPGAINKGILVAQSKAVSEASRNDAEAGENATMFAEEFEELVAVLYTGWMHVFIFTLCGITKGNEMPSS